DLSERSTEVDEVADDRWHYCHVLVGGGILAHGITPLAALEHHLVAAASEMTTFGSLLSHLLPLLLQIIYGLIAGAIVLVVMTSLSHLRAKFRAKSN
ncbi:MAG: hypothetical protein LRY40_08175, partial [Shewanella fodinae]|nr:hypothetical protein [Shewanella fodinae]